MKKIIIFISILISFLPLCAQNSDYNVPKRERGIRSPYNSFLQKSDYRISLYFSKTSASSFFDQQSNSINGFTDTVYLGKYSRDFTFNFMKHTLNVKGEKLIDSTILLFANVPISNYSLDELYKEFYDSSSSVTLPRQDKAKYNLLIIDYLELGIEYAVLKGLFEVEFGASTKIPFGSENGVAKNSREFWSDNAFEILSGIKSSFNSEKYQINLSSYYNYRGEDLKNRIITQLSAGIFTIPDSYIGAGVEWALSLSNLSEAFPFDIHHEPDMEEYIDDNVKFGLLINENLGTEIGYRVRLTGKNSWDYSGYKIIFFINFK